jgi:hypothetical protein
MHCTSCWLHRLPSECLGFSFVTGVSAILAKPTLLLELEIGRGDQGTLTPAATTYSNLNTPEPATYCIHLTVIVEHETTRPFLQLTSLNSTKRPIKTLKNYHHSATTGRARSLKYLCPNGAGTHRAKRLL